jgi:hypothetical protein
MSRWTKLSVFLVVIVLVGVGVGLFRLHAPALTKGGVAMIGTDAGYVIVGSERNRIEWQEGEIVHHWVGTPRTQPETVYFDRHQVHRASWAAVFSRTGFLIRFLPTRVDVIDLENLKGVYYSPRT